MQRKILERAKPFQEHSHPSRLSLRLVGSGLDLVLNSKPNSGKGKWDGEWLPCH